MVSLSPSTSETTAKTASEDSVPRFLSLQVKLSLLVGLPLIITGLVLGIVCYLLAEDYLRYEVRQRLERIIVDRHQMIQDYVDQQRERIALVTSRTQLRRHLEAYAKGTFDIDEVFSKTHPILEDARKSTTGFLKISITNKEGIVVTSTHKDDLRTNCADLEEFHKGRVSEGLGIPKRINDQYVSILSSPISTEAVADLGVVLVHLNVDKLQSILKKPFGQSSTGEVLVGRSQGEKIQFLFPPSHSQESTLAPSAAPMMNEALQQQPHTLTTWHESEEMLALYRSLQLQANEQPWRIVTQIGRAEAYQSLQKLKQIYILLMVCLLGVALLLSLWLARRITRSLRTLTINAAQIAEGDRPGMIHIESRDEIGLLASTFNEMNQRVADAHDQLEQRVEERTAEVTEAQKRAEAANEAKSMFLAQMSHEIRTPMNGVLGMSELLGETSLNEDQKKYLGYIRESAVSLLRLLNDLLDLSRIEAGKIDLDCVPFALDDFLTQLQLTGAILASEKSLQVTGHCASPLPPAIIGDPDRLRQILLNLLNNAIKFTPTGSVTFTAQLASEKPPSFNPGDVVELKFSIRDTGIGIPEEARKTVFEAFQQASAGIQRRFGGAGLGLHISAQLVALMKGNICLGPEVEEGTCFHVTIPFTVADLDQIQQVEDDSDLHEPGKLTILLAEDVIMNQRVVQGMLKKHGHRVVIANNGKEALDLLEKERFDVILMDVQMPEMDGLQATETYRERERNTGTHLPIIALTASAMREDRERCLQAGMDGFLSKPITSQDLFRTLRMYMPA